MLSACVSVTCSTVSDTGCEVSDTGGEVSETGGAPRSELLAELGEGATSRLVELTDALRAGGVRVGVGELLAAHRALRAIGGADRADAYTALQCVMCSRKDDLPRFTRAFIAVFGADPTVSEQPADEPGRSSAPRCPVP